MNEKLNIQNLIELLAERHGMEKADAESFVKEFFLLIEESLENDKYVKIKGMGTFKLIDVESRESVNINTGERFEIQGHTKVSFTPEPALKDLINRPFSHFETVVLNEGTVLEDTPVEDEGEEEEKEVVAAVEDKPVVTEEVVSVVEESVEVVEEPAREEEPQAEQPEVGPEQNETESEPEPPVAPQGEEKESTMKYFIGMVALALLLCIGAVAFVYYPDLFKKTPATQEEISPKQQVEEAVVPVAWTDTVVRKDTATLIAKKDTVAEVVTPKAVEKPKQVSQPKARTATAAKEKKKNAAKPFEADSLSYEIVGTKTTYTIKEGETLTRVALRFYGTKALWPYIVMHNPDVIKNPNNVPYGTVVKIPELAKK